MERFDELMERYANEKGFVWDSGGEAYNTALINFVTLSKEYAAIIPYEKFKVIVLNDNN